jgi:ABC-2 type transport system ATP-binding protein
MGWQIGMSQSSRRLKWNQNQECPVEILRVNQLSKFYGNHAAVSQVSFTIKLGEIVGLLGLNGAGKSTILKILGTFLAPSGGQVEMNGQSLETSVDAVRTMIGFLPDRPPLYDEMTVVAYLKFVAALKDVPRGDIDDKVRGVLGKTNLTEVAWTPLGELSHGYRQRVGIAQAIIHDPKIIILDEPINGLDPVQIVEMRDLILSLKKSHTVILSSHILSEITRTCDRILILDKGRLVAEGRPEDLEKRMAGGMRLAVECRQKIDIAVIESIAGVRTARYIPADSSGNYSLTIETDRDARSEIAARLIEGGAELLELRRDDRGLEGVFMSLVGSSGAEKGDRNV